MSDKTQIVTGDLAINHLDAAAALQHAVITELAQLAPEGFGETLREVPAVEEIRQRLLQALEDAARLWVALVDNCFGGFLLGYLEEHGDDLVAAPYMTVEYLAVSAAFRGMGIAHHLLTAAEAAALDGGCTTLELRVMASNRAAIAAYQRYGFELIEMRYARLLNGIAGLGKAES
jgi:ribosomal protein S18 acetylase RimI-like enzyme